MRLYAHRSELDSHFKRINMTKILFVQNMLYEYLGVAYLSAALKKANHHCDVFIEGYDNDLFSHEADIYAFSCTTGLHKWALRVAKEIKKRTHKLVIFGGPHATFFPEIINSPEVDIVGMGECEQAIVELADRWQKKQDITKIKNLWVKSKGKVYKNELRALTDNLDTLENPDRELYLGKYPFLRDLPRKAFFSGRGCPYNCTFCFNHSLNKLYTGKGRMVRRRSVGHVINEIKEVRKKYPLKAVFFQDDTFILHKEWVKEFMNKYKKEIRIPFLCLIRADLVDEGMVRCLKEGGCVTVFFGIESGNEVIRNDVLKKRISNAQIIRAGQLLRKYRIKFKTYNVLGFPGETVETAFETVHLNQKVKSDYPWCALLQPYPRTEIYEQLKAQHMIPAQFSLDDIHTSFFLDTVVVKDKELVNLQKLFFYAVKFPIMEPLIKKLIKLKPNKFFELAFLASYAYVYIRSESLGVFATIWFGLKHLKTFFYDLP